MTEYDGSKAEKPGFRVQKGTTHGPYTWGNGPKPESIFKRIAKAVVKRKK